MAVHLKNKLGYIFEIDFSRKFPNLLIIMGYFARSILDNVNIQVPRSREKTNKSIYWYSRHITTMIS
jgi:hypothetical protein